MTSIVVAGIVTLLVSLLVVVFVVPTLARRGGVLDQHAPSRIASARASVVAQAGLQGWSAAEGGDEFPASLRAEQVEPVTCQLVVTGPDFVAQSWDVTVRKAGAAVAGGAHQHLLRVPTASTIEVLLRPFPRPGRPMLLPAAFRGRMVEDGGPRGFLTGGDWAAASRQLEPLVPEIGEHEWWVVVADGHVTVTSEVEPDAEELQARLDLARRVAGVLA